MSDLENQGKECDQFSIDVYTDQVQSFSGFERRFQDIAEIEPVQRTYIFHWVKTQMLKILHLEWSHYLTWIQLKMKKRFETAN